MMMFLRRSYLLFLACELFGLRGDSSQERNGKFLILLQMREQQILDNRSSFIYFYFLLREWFKFKNISSFGFAISRFLINKLCQIFNST